MESNLDLYTEVWPSYFETQARDRIWYERLWAVLLRRLERSPGRELIEFGSGPGFLLKYAQKRGWRASGLEPSAVAREHAGKLGAFSLELLSGFRGLFDAGIATEVLEHVPDPLATLQEWRSALFPGGLLALSVPNDNNPLQRLFGRLLAPRGQERGGLIPVPDRDHPWRHPTHLHYFNPKSLRRLVESAGFSVLWQRTSFPVELLLVLPLPRHLSWKLSRLWPAPPLLWRWHLGRHCLLVARKV